MSTKTLLKENCKTYRDVYPAMMGILESMIKHGRTNKELRKALKDFDEVRDELHTD